MNNPVAVNIHKVNTLAIIAPHQRLAFIKPIGLLVLFFLTLGSSYATELTASPIATKHTAIKLESSHMWITIGDYRFKATLANTSAAREFAAMLPLTLDMDDLNSNEKHAELPKSLSTDPYQPVTINNGDLMLWGSRTMVVFYKKVNTSYSYTRIGHIDDTSGLSQQLGQGDVTLIFTKSAN